MKLVIRAADYGMVDCITDGCIKAIKDGVLNSVGLMTNNYQYAKRAAELIKEFDEISLGQEINLVSGIPASNPEDIPSLVNEEGRFLKSQERVRAGHPLIRFEDAYREVDAQMKRFVELVGRKPEYYSGHSYSTDTINQALKAAGDANGFLDRIEIINKANMAMVKNTWYRIPVARPGSDGRSEYLLDFQRNVNVVDMMIEELDKIKGSEYAWMNTHCGFCDGELMDMSSFSVIRGMERQALCSDRLKDWLKENNVELVTFRQIAEEVGITY